MHDQTRCWSAYWRWRCLWKNYDHSDWSIQANTAGSTYRLRCPQSCIEGESQWRCCSYNIENHEKQYFAYQLLTYVKPVNGLIRLHKWPPTKILERQIHLREIYRSSHEMLTERSTDCYLESNLRCLGNSRMFWTSQPTESVIEVFLIVVRYQWSSVFDWALEWTELVLDSGIDRVESRRHWRTLESDRHSPATSVHSRSIVYQCTCRCAFHNCTQQSHRPVGLCWRSTPMARTWIRSEQSVDRRSRSKCHLACYHHTVIRNRPCVPLHRSPWYHWELKRTRFHVYYNIVSASLPTQKDHVTAVLLGFLAVAHWGRLASLFGPWTVHVL